MTTLQTHRTNETGKPARLINGLFIAGIAGALISSSALSAATLLIFALGIWAIKTKQLQAAGWERPKELRLIHFGFWFFALISFSSWATQGFSYDGLKQLDNHVRLILFWPLAVAFAYAGVRAAIVLGACALAAAAAFVNVSLGVLDGPATWATLSEYRAGWNVNSITFGNLALLTAMISLVGTSLTWKQNQKAFAFAFLVASILGLASALLSQTRSNLIAFPLLALLLLPLMSKKSRVSLFLLIIAVTATTLINSSRIMNVLENGLLDQSIQFRFIMWQHAWQLFLENPWFGSGLTGYSDTLREAAAAGQIPPQLAECCAGHAHNDVLHILATKGLLGGLSWLFLLLIPLAAFWRQVGHKDLPAAHLAVAGTMVPVAYIVFGLTEATLNRSMYLTVYLVMVSAIGAALYGQISRSWRRQRKVKVSATIITKNEEQHIRDCIKSARLVADEVIVLDSGSSDRTVEIAKGLADVVEVTDWPGFGVQKQRALDKASGDWVLSIDADERITPELAREINDTLSAPDADAYKLPWAVTLYGTRLDFGRSGRAPLRLFRREGVRFSDALVHEKILIPKGRVTKTLRGRLTHYTHRDFGHALEKSAKYAWLGSQQKYRKNKRTRTLLYPTFRGILTFVQVYLIRFGFLDGAVGYLVAVTYAQGSFNKYAGLWTLCKRSHNGDIE